MRVKANGSGWLFLACALLLVACEGAVPMGPDAAVGPALELGERCTDSTECTSGLCVGVGEGLGVCSRSCASRRDCPEGDNWSCVMPSERPDLAVCGCQPDADEERCADGRDNDCDGRTDNCLTCAGRVIAGDDDEHCGACFNSCRADEECRGGECACRERAEVFCDGLCTDVSRDARDCGACGNACRPGDVCTDGACTCPEGRSGRCADGCYDFSSDPTHCGSCDIACEAGLECIDGACACPADRPDRCGDECVDLSTDGRHCGACGSACGEGTVCRAAACECEASTVSDRCDGVGCVDFATDPAHCGGCGNTCPSGLVCRAGTCACATSSAPDYCAGFGCTTLDHDTSNCGACGNACPTGLACNGGTCQCLDASDTLCDGECVSTAWDARHCGGCGIECLPGEGCRTGSCTCAGIVCDGRCISEGPASCGSCGVSCGPGQVCSRSACVCPSTDQTFCGDGCHNLYNDFANCGSCGNACGPGQTCVGGCLCPSGQTWCASLGACVSLSTDPTSCGVCGNACHPGEVCSSGTCRCSSYYQTYCESAGACVDTRYDESHCGGCDAACAPDQTCSSGTCNCTLSSDRFCSSTGACTDVRSNDAHCGACDAPCPSGAGCVDYACVCAVTGETPCATGCTDLQSDDTNCGACGTACGASEECRSGICACPAPALGAERRITTSYGESTDVRLARSPAGMAMVYTDVTVVPGRSNVYFQLSTADGAPVGSVRALTSLTSPGDDAFDPDVVWTGSGWGVVWYQDHDPPSGGPDRQILVVQLLAADGTPVAPAEETELRDATGSWYRVDRIRLEHTPMLGLVAAYRAAAKPRFRVLGDGSAPWPELALSTLTSQSDADIAVGPAGEIGVVYVDNYYDVVFQQLERDGRLLRSPVFLNRYASSARVAREPALTHDGSRFLATFSRAQRPASISQHDVLVCYVDDCASPTLLYRWEENTSDLILYDLRIEAFGDTAVVGWKQTDGAGHDIRGLRVRLAPSGPPTFIEPAMEYMPTPTTYHARGWDLALASTTSLLIAWDDDRWSSWEVYDRPIDLGTCPP